MLSQLAASSLLLAAVTLAALGAILLVAGTVALRRARPIRFTLHTLTGLLLLSVGALAATVGSGMQGYRALTHEEIAARVVVRPAGPQRFAATFAFPDGREQTFELAGDEIYVDARILKWKPVAPTASPSTSSFRGNTTGSRGTSGRSMQERWTPPYPSATSRRPGRLPRPRQEWKAGFTI